MRYRFLFLISLIFAPVAFSQPDFEIKKMNLEFGAVDVPPFYNVENGELVGGICSEIMQKTLKKAGIPFHVKIYPMSRLYSNLVSGHTNLFIGIKEVPAYEGKVYFGKSPVAQAVLGVYSINLKKRIEKKEDLIGKSIIVIRGYSYSGLINFLNDPKNKIRVERAMNHKEGLKMLEAARAEYFLDYTHTVQKLLVENPIDSITHSVISSVPLYFVVSKKTPDAERIAERLSKQWEQIKGQRRP